MQASGNGGTTWTEVGRITRRRQRQQLRLQELQHHRLSWPQHRDPLRGLDERSFPADYVDIDDVEITYNTAYGEGDPAPVDVNAKHLHAAGIRGRDVGVAVIDTGYWKVDSLDKDSGGNGRVAAQYDADHQHGRQHLVPVSTDTTGHGTHVTSLIASSRKNNGSYYYGVAPDARIISIKAFGEDGSSTYATVIRGIDWVITNKNPHAIRVLNFR